MKFELTIAFAAALAGLLAGGFVSDRSIRALAESDRRVNHTHEVLGQVRVVRITLTDAEAGQRGYLLTGRNEHMRPFDRAAAELPAELDRLEAMTADNPAQQARVRQLRRVAEERFAALQQVAAVRRDAAHGLSDAVRIIDTGRGLALMGELRRLSGELEAEEEQLLRVRMASAAAADRTAGRTLAAAIAVGVTLLGIVVTLARRRARDRDRAAAVLRAAHDALEERVRARTEKLAAANRALQADVAERVRTEAALRASEERFRELADAMPQIVFALAPDGRVEYQNRRATETLGALDASDPSAAVHPEDRGTLTARSGAAMAAGEPFECEYRLRMKGSGEYRWHLGRAVPVRDATGRVTRWYGTATDVHARRGLEEQLRQSQKMEAFGQLAGGVAHDFNNLLTVINGYSSMLLNGLAPSAPAAEPLSEIRGAGERAAALTRQLLAFGRKQVLRPRVLDLNELVHNLYKMLVRLIGEDVRLALALAPRLGQVTADPGQLEQVLMNLCVNARDAMPQGGRLTIETDDVERPRAGGPPARHIRLAVSDTGCGMTPAVQARIFEPFFTTKAVGQGTGLGLATVFGIVEQSGGYLEVSSEVGVGTTFAVFLPVTGDASEPEEVTAEVHPPRGHESILLVEDERPVRVLAARTLRAAGYTVLEAEGSEDAVRVAAAARGPLDLLLTDVVMPGASGREMAERLVTAHPGIGVLYMSGHTDDAVVRHGIRHDRVNFLQKPFTPVTLALKVREVLDAQTALAGG